MSVETPSFELTISYSDTLGGSQTELGNLTNCSLPECEANKVETTTYDSAGKWRTYRSGYKDPGTLGGTIHYVDATKADLLDTLFASEANKFWHVGYPDGAVYSVEGFLSKLGDDAPMDGIISTNFEATLSGEPVFTENAS